MPGLDINILKANIRELLRNTGTTQEELAKILGMSQGNVSKALSERDKKCFTVDQLCLLSQHFGKSLDELVGNKAAEQVSARPDLILKFLVSLLCSKDMKVISVKVEESVYKAEDSLNNPHYYEKKLKENRYNAFYFPDYLDPLYLASDEDENFELQSEFYQLGNDSKYAEMNKILDKIMPIIKLYQKEEISEEAFRMIEDGYLQQLHVEGKGR